MWFELLPPARHTLHPSDKDLELANTNFLRLRQWPRISPSISARFECTKPHAQPTTLLHERQQTGRFVDCIDLCGCEVNVQMFTLYHLHLAVPMLIPLIHARFSRQLHIMPAEGSVQMGARLRLTYGSV